MSDKRKIFIVSDKDRITENIKNITKEYYKLEKITEYNKNLCNSVILYDLTGCDLKNNNFLKDIGLSKDKILKYLENNLSPLAIIDETQKDCADKILNANFEDFFILPLFDAKIRATLNNTLRNVEYTEELNKLY